MDVKIPRFVIAGLSGDAGKTIVSLSLLAGFRRKGLTVSAFKKGPDFIDPAWLSESAGSTCHNLDTFLMEPEDILRTFVVRASESDIAVVEGNRGLFDGQDAVGTHSTAQLARMLGAPVILVVDAAKATRTIAALVKGCQVFDPKVNIAGIVLNRVGGKRHRRVVTQAIEEYCGLPVVGVIPRLGADADLIPGRHLGLVPPTEFGSRDDYEDKLVRIASEHLDLDQVIEIAGCVEPLAKMEPVEHTAVNDRVRIGYFSGSAFTFYYPENLEALQFAGAELTAIDPVTDKILPELDGLYIGGGFPETHAAGLSKNKSMMQSVRKASESDLPIYAECGGLIYLSRSINWQDEEYPMAGVFPVDLTMSVRPIGHGYSVLKAVEDNPFFVCGETIKGHEFHYSGPVDNEAAPSCCLQVESGTGVTGQRDGLLSKSTLACYTHIHALGFKQWAPRFVASARDFRHRRSLTDSSGSSGELSEEVDKSGRCVA